MRVFVEFGDRYLGVETCRTGAVMDNDVVMRRGGEGRGDRKETPYHFTFCDGVGLIYH